MRLRSEFEDTHNGHDYCGCLHGEECGKNGNNGQCYHRPRDELDWGYWLDHQSVNKNKCKCECSTSGNVSICKQWLEQKLINSDGHDSLIVTSWCSQYGSRRESERGDFQQQPFVSNSVENFKHVGWYQVYFPVVVEFSRPGVRQGPVDLRFNCEIGIHVDSRPVVLRFWETNAVVQKHPVSKWRTFPVLIRSKKKGNVMRRRNRGCGMIGLNGIRGISRGKNLISPVEFTGKIAKEIVDKRKVRSSRIAGNCFGKGPKRAATSAGWEWTLFCRGWSVLRLTL